MAHSSGDETRQWKSATMLVVAALVSAVAGFAIGYSLRPGPTVRVEPSKVELSNVAFTCVPSHTPPYLEGNLSFDLRSTYWMQVTAEVAYLGNWTGDTDQTLEANGSKHVVISWGPDLGRDQRISVTECPNVTVRIWRISQVLEACPNPPC